MLSNGPGNQVPADCGRPRANLRALDAADDAGDAADEVFSTIEQALADIAQGRFVVVVDDEDRENEGDLVMAGQFVTPDAINFLTRQAGGWICLALTPERCDELGLKLMTAKNETLHQTPFTVTIEAREGVTTGISVQDQAHTMQVAIDPTKGPADIVVGGHVHPLKAKRGGVLERAGHTEAAVELARLAGLNPAGVICEIQNDDGSMARGDDLVAYCRRHGLRMITIADLIAYRRRHDKLVERGVTIRLPTRFGDFNAVGYRSLVDDKHHVALIKGAVLGKKDVLVRVHSECLTGDVFHSLRCDCGEQLEAALEMIERERGGGPALSRAGGSRDRTAEQAARLQAPGGGIRHRRRQPAARFAGGPTRLRHRRADPRRSRPELDSPLDQQPEEDPWSGGLRPAGHRSDHAQANAECPQRGLPAREGGADGPRCRAAPQSRRRLSQECLVA